MSESIEVHEVRLELERVTAGRTVLLPGALRPDMEFLMETRDRLAAQLNAFMLQENLDPSEFLQVVSYPKSWWQHFKQDVFPGWLLDRFPVRKKRVSVRFRCDHTMAYPNAAVALPPEVYGEGVFKVRSVTEVSP